MELQTLQHKSATMWSLSLLIEKILNVVKSKDCENLCI